MYPRVTEILHAVGLGTDYSTVPPHVLQHAAERGTAVHKAIELHEKNDLDEASLHPEIAPYFEAYLRFKKESAFEYLCGEMQVVSRAWGVVGHPDAQGFLNARRSIIDVKCVATIDLDYVNFQVAGYRLCFDEEHPAEPIGAGYALQLFPDAKYRLHELKRPDARQVFQAAVIVHRVRMGGRNAEQHSAAA